MKKCLRDIVAGFVFTTCLLTAHCNPNPTPDPYEITGGSSTTGGCAGFAGETADGGSTSTGGTPSGGQLSTGGSIEPNPVQPDVDAACQHVVSLGCATYADCVSVFEDVLDASVNPELDCVIVASSCLEVESCD